MLIGLDGIHPEQGVTAHHPDEAAVNRAMANQARQTIAVADHTKVGKVARARVCSLVQIDILITGNELADEEHILFDTPKLEIRMI